MVVVALAAASVVVVVFAKSSLASQALLFFSEDKIFTNFARTGFCVGLVSTETEVIDVGIDFVTPECAYLILFHLGKQG